MANKALLVGINKYKMSDADLQGCVNYVTNMRDILLKYFSFAAKDIRVLVDERATKRISWRGSRGLSVVQRQMIGCFSIIPGMAHR